MPKRNRPNEKSSFANIKNTYIKRLCEWLHNDKGVKEKDCKKLAFAIALKLKRNG